MFIIYKIQLWFPRKKMYITLKVYIIDVISGSRQLYILIYLYYSEMSNVILYSLKCIG